MIRKFSLQKENYIIMSCFEWGLLENVSKLVFVLHKNVYNIMLFFKQNMQKNVNNFLLKFHKGVTRGVYGSSIIGVRFCNE